MAHEKSIAGCAPRVVAGARLERINWLGNAAPRAIQQSFGIMVNYLYDHDSIEDNHELFVRDGTIVRSSDVDALLRGAGA
jgi:malonyl-CoA decarboxylase